MFTVCFLYSIEHKKSYVGYTSDLNNRLKSHNELSTKGFTVKYRPWTLSFKQEFGTKQEGMERELFLKTGKGRLFLSEIIANLIFDKKH